MGQMGFVDVFMDGRAKSPVLDKISQLLDLKELSILVDEHFNPHLYG